MAVPAMLAPEPTRCQKGRIEEQPVGIARVPSLPHLESYSRFGRFARQKTTFFIFFRLNCGIVSHSNLKTGCRFALLYGTCTILRLRSEPTIKEGRYGRNNRIETI